MPKSRITKAHYESLSEFRRSLRSFLSFSETAARGAGLTPQQHQALLAIKGAPGRDYLSVGELALRLKLRHHSAVGLVDRLAARRLVRRVPAPEDGRRVEVRLSQLGEQKIEQLSAAHLAELRNMGPVLRGLLRAVGG